MRFLNKFIFIIILFAFQAEMHAQEWKTAKDKDGITIYTRQIPGNHFNTFKGEVEFRADLSEVSDLIEDVKNFDLWDESISEIRIIESIKGKSITYYVVYDSPWPVTDRDLGIQAVISDDLQTGSRIITAKSAPDILPPDPDLIRIINYWQQWTISPDGEGLVHITVEGFADPAGDIPAWLANMAITNTPFNMLREIRNSTQK